MSTRSREDILEEYERDKGGFHHSAFGQQKIRAWHPVLAPKWMIGVMVLVGVGSIILGSIMLVTSLSLVECSKQYNDPPVGCASPCRQRVTLETSDCKGVKSDEIPGPIFFYYGLTNFYQNHRRYLLSRNMEQLSGKAIVDVKALKDCLPALFTDDGLHILSPCGLAARSVFNDTFELMQTPSEAYIMREGVEDIVWPKDLISLFKNPVENENNVASLNTIHQWLPEDVFPGKVENAHFMVWMRNAALPNFRKLYGIVDSPITLPLQVSISNRYRVSYFGGKKYIYFSTTSWMGGRNMFLSLLFITMGSSLALVSFFMSLKNRRDPRILGDVRFLKWTKGKHA